MLKRVVRMFVHDSPWGRSPRMRDDVLAALPIGKVIVSGTVWAGSLLPLIDAIASTLGPAINNGFTSGNTLSAERLADVIALGRTWTGSLLSEIRAAAASTSSGPTVDGTETLAEAERLDKLLRSAAPTNAIADGLVRLRRTADKVGGARTRDAVNPLARLVRITPEHRALGERLNQQARDFWVAQSTPATSRPIGDNTAAKTTAVRDQLAIAARATDMRTKMTALNAAARAFWGGA